MQLGMIGLGRMGANMVRRLLRNSHQCVVFDTNPDVVAGLVAEGAIGATSLEGVDPAAIVLPSLPNDYSARVNAVVAALRADATQAQRLRVVREGAGDAHEVRFHWHMVEDRQNFPNGNVSYSEYVTIVLRESQMGQMGGAGAPN